jgi:hypothetical protein
MAYLDHFGKHLKVTDEADHAADPPFRGIGNVDILSKAKDGSIELVAVSYEHLDSSAATKKMLIEKLEGYLEFIHSEKFLEKFGAPDCGRVSIRLSCIDEPSPEIVGLLSKMKPEIERNHARFYWEIKSSTFGT